MDAEKRNSADRADQLSRLVQAEEGSEGVEPLLSAEGEMWRTGY
ncbi:hypothetical protein ABIE61_000352 [Marinobacterium sp. MBR-111]|jgi:hypothetical protein